MCHFVRVYGLDFDHPNRITQQKKRLGVLDGHDDEGFVVVINADLDDCCNTIADNTWYSAHWRCLARRIDQRNLTADLRTDCLGQA